MVGGGSRWRRGVVRRADPVAQPAGAALELDDIDIRILNLLQADARLSIRQLAKAVSLSTTPVHERLRKLESSGVIDHYGAVLNTARLGSFIAFFVNITLKCIFLRIVTTRSRDVDHLFSAC